MRVKRKKTRKKKVEKKQKIIIKYSRGAAAHLRCFDTSRRRRRVRRGKNEFSYYYFYYFFHFYSYPVVPVTTCDVLLFSKEKPNPQAHMGRLG